MPRKLRSYTVDFKLNVINWHGENGKNIAKTGREFKIDDSASEWLANEDILRQICYGISNELNGTEDHLFSANLSRALNAAPPNDNDTDSDTAYDGETDNYEYSEDEGLED